MIFDWEDYLTLAEALQKNPNTPGPSEASLRAATSRAYYAAFQCALDFARTEGFQPSYSGSDHWDVRRHFRNDKSNRIRRKISVELGRMYDNRRQADYNKKLSTSPNTLAYLTIGMARSVIEKLKSLSAKQK